MSQILNLSFMKPCPDVPSLVDKKTSKKYINWGENNTLPQYLWDNYLKCSNLQALVNTVVDYTAGDGIVTENKNYDKTSIEEVIRKCIFDYTLFGGFAVECLRSRTDNVTQINYINVMNVRVDEELTTAFISNQWGIWSGKNIVQLPLFNPKKNQSHFVLYYRGTITRNINPVPMWFAALKSVEVLNQVRTYNLNNITNNFSSNFVITLNGTAIKSSELEEIEDKLNNKFAGAENAGKTLLINNTNSDGRVELTRLDSDKAADIYSNVQENSVNDLYVAFRINPLLVGINQQTGFNTQEFSNSYKLYEKTVIKPIQNEFIKCFKSIGIDISFNPFIINWV